MGEISGCEENALGWGEVLLDVERCGEADYAGSVWLQMGGVVSGADVVVLGDVGIEKRRTLLLQWFLFQSLCCGWYWFCRLVGLCVYVSTK